MSGAGVRARRHAVDRTQYLRGLGQLRPYCGASVDFVDIDPATFNISIPALTEKLAAARLAGTLPKIVVPVDLCGQPNLAAIRALADDYGFAIIEDASHAVGGNYQGRKVGDGRYADITIFSFHPVKIITTAEGGMAMTNSAALASRMELFRSHGITRDPALMTQAPDGPWYYQQIELGYNYRMTELQAALGLSQLDRLDAYVTRRAAIAARYDDLLADLPLTRPEQHPDTASAWHLYVIRLDLDKITQTHRAVFEALRAADLGVNLHYIPVHMQPYYRAKGFNPGDFPAAEAYYTNAISIPLYAAMTDADQDRVVEVLRDVLSA
jgi:dTDP-4-amino-4,6-dideoxygalactose transaminase